MTWGSATRRELLRGIGSSVAGSVLATAATRPGIAATDEVWPQFGYDDANTGYAPTNTGPVDEVAEQWSFSTGNNVRPQPVVVGDTVYVGSDDNVLYALAREDGSERWRLETGGRISAAATVSDGTMYVGSRDENLYAVSTADGTVRWTFDAGSKIDAAPAVAGDTVYVGCDSGVFAVSTADGSQRWYNEGRVGYTSAIAVAGETVFAVESNRLVAMQRSDGSTRWTFSLGDAIGRQIPSVADGTVYIGNDDGAIYAVSAANGKQRWKYDTNGAVQAAPSLAGGTAYVGNHGGKFYALDAAEGTKEWTYEAGGKIQSSPVVGDTVYLSTTAGDRIVALSTADGSVRWEHSTGGYLVSAPAVVNETIYVGCGHDICAFAPDPPTPTPTPTPISGRSETRSRTSTEVPADGPGLTETPPPTTPGARKGNQGGIDAVPAVLGLLGLAGLGGAGTWWLTRTDTGDGSAGPTGEQPPPSQPQRPPDGSAPPSPGVTSSQPPGPSNSRIPADVPRAPDVSVEYDALTDKEPIGGGGNADVTKARLPTPDGDVTLAIKEPRMAGTLHTEAVQRMFDEAETWSKLDDHDHIVGVVDYGSEPIPWIAMEYMDAGHLGERSGELGTAQALWTAVAVTRGVRHAHRRGVAHLDLKPDNVLFRSVEDAWDVPKVADWGLSKHLLEHSKSVDGMSVEYAAPEQFDEGHGRADDITDVYQLGAVFYELFTGRPPFEGRPYEVMDMIRTGRPTPPSEIADVPAALDDILLTALATEKADRYDDIVYLRDDLEGLFDEW